MGLAALLEEPTDSVPDHTNDNALVENEFGGGSGSGQSYNIFPMSSNLFDKKFLGYEAGLLDSLAIIVYNIGLGFIRDSIVKRRTGMQSKDFSADRFIYQDGMVRSIELWGESETTPFPERTPDERFEDEAKRMKGLEYDDDKIMPPYASAAIFVDKRVIDDFVTKLKDRKVNYKVWHGDKKIPE